MTTITMEFPESTLATFSADPQGFARQMRIAAAVKWYELGKVSQSRGAEIAGLSRSMFIDALSESQVSVLQVTREQLREELGNVD